MSTKIVIIATLVEGETARLTLPLLEDEEAFVGTGFTVSDLLLTGNDETEVSTAGDFGWIDAAAGTVYYDPDADDFSASLSPYRIRVEITDGNGKVRYHPNDRSARIVVLPVRG